MRLFVYGILMRDLARGRAAELVAELDDGLPATTHGHLYAMQGEDGWYPILLSDPRGEEVHGIVHEAGAVELRAMDAFENAHGGPDAEFRRESIAVMLPNGFVTDADAYCYARQVPENARPIRHGDFGRWLHETGRQALVTRADG